MASTGASSGSAGRDHTAELAEERGEVGRLVVGVQAARVGQDPDPRAADGLGLKAEPRAWPGEGSPIGADAEEGEDARAVAPGLGREPPPTGPELVRGELVGGGGGAGDDVGDA